MKLDNRLDIFAATPPLEEKKLLFSWAVTEGVGYEKGKKKEGMKLDFSDVRRAYFHAEALRKVYIELPDEDSEIGRVGLLLKAMHGTRDAAQNWAVAYTKCLQAIGFKKGAANPCVLEHDRKGLKRVVHGDDFAVLGWEASPDWFWEKMSERFDCKHRGRLDPQIKTISK